MEEIGTDLSPYSCRHTFATLAIKSGIKPEQLKQIIGHASYSTTVDFYNHTNAQELVAAAQKITVTVTLQSPKTKAEKAPVKSSENK